jgi:hypothetical protein
VSGRRRKGKIDKMARLIADEIDAMSTQNLTRLLLGIASMSERNVWWFTYRIAPAIKDYTTNELQLRAQSKATAAEVKA